MPKRRTTWREKLEKEVEPKIVEAEPRGSMSGKMLIPRPLDVDALMRKIEPGKLATVAQIRERLANDFGTDFCCPMTTGIFIWLAAGAAEEDLSNGRNDITPYWRVIKADGSLNEKFPGGVEAQASHLRAEGHVIRPAAGKKLPKVLDFERCLQNFC